MNLEALRAKETHERRLDELARGVKPAAAHITNGM
jgi:hypothetical protein